MKSPREISKKIVELRQAEERARKDSRYHEAITIVCWIDALEWVLQKEANR